MLSRWQCSCLVRQGKALADSGIRRACALFGMGHQRKTPDSWRDRFDKCICMFNSAKPAGSIMQISNCHEGAISSATYDNDTKSLVTGSYDGCLKLWSHEGHCLDTFNNLTDCIMSIAYIPQTKCYWVTGKERYPIIIDALAPANVTDWVADTCSFRNLPLSKVFHARDTDVAIGLTTDREIIVWRYNNFGPHCVLQGHSDWVETIIVAHRKQTKIKADAMKATASIKKLFPSFSKDYEKIQMKLGKDDFIPYDIEVYSGGGDGALLKWQNDSTLKTWARSEVGPLLQHPILCMLHQQELDVLITGSEDAKIRVWNLDGSIGVSRSKKAAQAASQGPDVLKGHTGKINALVVCNNNILVSGSDDKSLRWWDLKMCFPLDTIESAHDFPIQDLEYCAKTDELASCAGEPGFKLWNATKRRRLKSVPSTVGDIIMVKWCNMDDGYWLTAADDGTIALWDPSSLCAIRSICYRKERVTALLVDEANMLLLVSMQSDYAIRAYRLDLVGEEVCAYTGHTEQVHTLAYLGNMKQYLSGSWDNSIRIWFAPASGPGDVVTQEKRLSNGVDEKKLKSTKEAEFAEEARYVSEYEREHPLVMPKQLQDMKASIPPDKALKQSSTGSSAGKAGDPVRLPSLVFKLASLERALNERIA